MRYLIGIVLGVVLPMVLLHRNSRELELWRINILLVGLGVAAGVGAKLYSGIERGGFVWHDPIFELASGYRYPGAILAVLIALPLLYRVLRPGVAVGQILDSGVLGVCAAMVVIRAGCFDAGCCHGTLTELPWATRYAADSAPWHAHVAARLIPATAQWSHYGHPLQIYFLAAIAAIGVFLLWFRGRQTYDGQLTLVFMVLNGVSKGALESLRFEYVASLQLYSFVMAAVGAFGLVWAAHGRKRAR